MATILKTSEEKETGIKRSEEKRISPEILPGRNLSDVSKSKVTPGLEKSLYFCLKIALMIAANLILYSRFGFFSGTIEMHFLVPMVVVVYLIGLIKIPASGHHLRTGRHPELKYFIKSESKFMILISALLYLLEINIIPAQLTIFLAINFVVQTMLLLAWRKYNFIQAGKRRDRFVVSDKNVLILGSKWRGKSAADLFLNHPELRMRPLGFVDYRKEMLWRYRDVPLVGNPDNLASIILHNQVDCLVMANEPEDFNRSYDIFKLVENMGVNIIVFPDLYHYNLSRCSVSSFNGRAALIYCSCKLSGIQEFVKNIADRIGAVLGLLIFSPVLLLAAVAIKLDSRGPVFYRQKRCGKNGRIFEMLKLRTMVDNADVKKKYLMHLNEMNGPVFKIKKDPRITRIGKFLRKFSIDELPQFINILKGDMSLVGPRPPLPEEVIKYKPWQHRKLSVKPGATCLWQINGRNDVDFDEWMELDLRYIDNWSFREDARILLKTLPAVIKGNGAS